MGSAASQDERIAKMSFASVYPHYVSKIERKGRNISELHEVVAWLTGFTWPEVEVLIQQKATFQEFFERATLPEAATEIKGVICGYRVEEIENKLTQKVRYLDKLVDELAKGRKMDKILRVLP